MKGSEMLVSQLCLSLCDPINCSPPGSSFHGILQEWVAIPFSRSSWPRDQTLVSCIAGEFFTIWATRKALYAAKSLQWCLTLCDPTDGSPTGSAIPGILQARTLEWFAISFSNARKWKVKVKSLSKCLTLRDPMDYSLPGSSIHGIFQARVLEWVAIAFCESPVC